MCRRRQMFLPLDRCLDCLPRATSEGPLGEMRQSCASSEIERLPSYIVCIVFGKKECQIKFVVTCILSRMSCRQVVVKKN